MFFRTYYLTFSTLAFIFRRIGDKNILLYIYVLFAFLFTAVLILYVRASLCDITPQLKIVAFFNMLLKFKRHEPLIISNLFLNQDQNVSCLLPEDYLIYRQVWSQSYFPKQWFSSKHDKEKYSLKLTSTIKLRTERILYLNQ